MADDQVNMDADPSSSLKMNPHPRKKKANHSGASGGGGRKLIRNIRLSEDEYEELKEIASACSIPVSTYIRMAALQRHVKSKVDQSAVREMSLANTNLARVGNLLKLWISLDADDPKHPSNLGTSVDDVLDLFGELLEAKSDIQKKGSQLLRELSD